MKKTYNILLQNTTLTYLVSAILITIPLKFIFGSIASILFLTVVLATLSKPKYINNKALLLPVGLYVLMCLSLFWTTNFKFSVAGLQKELLLLLLPLAFLFSPKARAISIQKVIKTYSYAMVFFGGYYFLKAIFRYIKTQNKDVFFYHELVTLDLNAIYMSVFFSFALFYFLSLNKRNTVQKYCLALLSVIVFLLSSKSIIFIDVLLVVIYYSFYSKVKTGIRSFTIISILLFITLSLFFVPKVKQRFLLEYETAFVDNTVNNNIAGKVYNVSLNQAWNLEKFNHNHFFPGTALRVYQFRIFLEIVKQKKVVLSGLGLEASQKSVKEKELEHHLYPGYGDYNFHNQYIQTFIELGFFGFIIVALLNFINIKNAIKSKNFLHFAFALTMLILFFTESFFCRQRGIVFFITLYCIFNGTQTTKIKQNE